MRLPAFVFISIAFIAASSVVDAVPVHQWSQQFGSSDSDVGYGIAADASGNVLVTGHYGPGGNAFVAKYDPNGVQVWIQWLGFGKGFDVTADAAGNVLVTGALGTYPPSANPVVDIFVKKFDAAGTPLWSKTFATPGTDEGLGIATDLSGNVAVTGRFSGTVDFGGGSLATAGSDDIFVAEYDTNGSHLWSRRFGDTSNDYGSAIVIDGSGNVVVCGSFRGSVNFGGGPLASAGGFDMFVAKYDAGGNHQWSHRYGSSAFNDYAADVALDGSDNVVVSGTFTGTVDFGGGPITSVGSGDIFVAKYDPTGAHQWSKRFGSTSFNQGTSVDVDASDNVFVTGYFQGTVDFGGGPLVSLGQDDVFLAKFDANGAHKWSQRFGDTNYDHAGAVAVDPAGNIVTTGSIVGAGGEDIYIAKFATDQPVPTLVTRFEAVPVDGNVTIRWNIQSDEDIENFALYRRHDSALISSVIAESQLTANSRSFIDTSVEPGNTYHYELVIRTGAGDEFRSPIATATIPTLVASLGQNQPNPFNPTTTIEYTLSERSPAVLNIYDAAGSLVARLDQGVQGAGLHRVQWDGRDVHGHSVASGVYLYRMEGMRREGPRKMVLLK
jgi:hypothetical protein